ncbi:MAG: methionyl-tRNA formyltransferase [Flavobacteriales bacterium]|nr:methionyl-tRNA formyltransferase [Flavobacteriales bacterium]
MQYNTSLSPLIIPEYGRHIHTMAQSLLKIDNREKRNQQAQILIKIMGNLNSHLRDVEEYKHKLWDHLHILCEHKLDVDTPFSGETLEFKSQKTERIQNTQGSVKHKHYGKLIIKLIKECIKIENLSLRDQLLNQIAQQMKRSFLNWNKSNVQDEQIWHDLESFSEEKINLDYQKVIPVFHQQPIRKKTFFKRSNKKNYSRSK